MSRQPGERTLQHSRSSTAQEKSPRKRLAAPGRGAAGGAGGTISSKGGDADRSRKRARQTAVPRRKAPPARAGGAVIGGGTLLEEQRAASTRRRGGGSGYLRPTSRCTASQNSCLTASPLSVPLSKSADISRRARCVPNICSVSSRCIFRRIAAIFGKPLRRQRQRPACDPRTSGPRASIEQRADAALPFQPKRFGS